MVELSRDREFIHTAIHSAFRIGSFQESRHLNLTVAEYGDVRLSINLFPAARGRPIGISADHIHHHGWRLLTSSVIEGGYDTIVFARQSHEHRSNGVPNLRVAEEFRHSPGRARFIDSYTCHVVFHPGSLCATLALWSGDKVRANQSIKRMLSPFPGFRNALASAAHSMRIGELLGLNPVTGLYFAPIDGVMSPVEKHASHDIGREDVLGCYLSLFDLVEFQDAGVLDSLKAGATARSAALIEKLKAGLSIPDHVVPVNPPRRYSREELLQAIQGRAVP